MQKICLSASLFFLSILSSFSQTAPPDSDSFKSRKLKAEEVNFVSSYYNQDGDNSAVTGGIGTEKLTDISSVFDISLTRTDLRNRLHTLRLEAGIDHYTSASSDRIDPNTISSASASDNRFYPGVTWTRLDAEKHYTLGASLSMSREYDYFSKGASFNFSQFSKDHNREFGLTLGAYLDTWKIIYPIELRTLATSTGLIPNPEASGSKPRNSYNASFVLTQVINKRMQLSLLLDLAFQSGQLATPYQRVYFQDKSVHVEHLPAQRLKIPAGIRFNYFATDRVVLRSFYRFYTDDWGITAHTAELEVPYKLTPFLSLSPFYRFYTQTAADYFAGYQQHGMQQAFYTSDYDLSAFNSHLAGLNLRLNSASGILGINKLNTVEIRYGHYNRSNGLISNSITLGVTLK
ncbi:hypothetical protein AAE02nite_47900 [Adhaeribacter aerolatus]|uniref:DUF3570 domain-containing protein n=1 Tax=Adhaeribacter aerolatus TaxID=670289 RepID=A0A512B569_9BACT|nr:DUF3570 domain-containing protein [Adhaeribacter aerolatus]GEO07126.1 hypothetical protein AAE02nite_47900 [Adhaeribacter aerolatus]